MNKKETTMRKPILAASLALAVMTGAVVYHRAFAARLQEIGTNIEMLSDGHVRLNVINTTNLPISALAAVGTRTLLAKPATDRSVRFFDSVLNPFGPKELAPGKNYTFNFFGEKDDFTAAKTAAEKQMVEVAYEEALFLLQDGKRAHGNNAPLPEATGQARGRLLLRVNRLQVSKPPLAN
ncbi:MAG: hypothetical protein DMG53_02300 [Acidobacteria bacterium]|nr:MAG: hypothetical protein DMG53_02300 [Acidobacteriota bacterium]